MLELLQDATPLGIFVAAILTLLAVWFLVLLSNAGRYVGCALNARHLMHPFPRYVRKTNVWSTSRRSRNPLLRNLRRSADWRVRNAMP